MYERVYPGLDINYLVYVLVFPYICYMRSEKYKHGGNHHPAANYDLSLFDKKRYSKNMNKYKRGGETDSNGEKEVYDGPLKDLTIHHFFQFVNEDGSPKLEFRPEWVKNGKLDPEVDKWRSKHRGLSTREIIQWYISTQLAVPQIAHSNHADGSTWQGQNYGKFRRVKFEDDGAPMLDIDGYPIYHEYNEDDHNEWIQKSKNGDSDASWYPTSMKDAFALAHDMDMPFFFYDGEPYHGFTPDQLTKMDEEQEEADRIAQEKWYDYHSTNPSEQYNKWSKSQHLNENRYDDHDDMYAYDRMDISELSDETIAYVQRNNPKMLKYVDANFDNEEDALEFLNNKGAHHIGGFVTVNGKNILMQDFNNYPGSIEGRYQSNDLSGTYFDANLAAYGQLLENNWHRASTLDASQELHNKTASIGGDLSQLRGNGTGPVMMDYQDAVSWLNRVDPNGKLYNWKTSYTGTGGKYVEFLPMVDGNSEEAETKWRNNLDHSSYQPNYQKVTSSNFEDAVKTHAEDGFVGSYHQDGYDTPGRSYGTGQPTYKIDGKKVTNPFYSSSLPTQKGLQSIISLENVFTSVTGTKLIGWGGKALKGYLGSSAIRGGNAVKNLWTGARHPFKTAGGFRTFKDGAWQFTKNLGATAYQPFKAGSNAYQKSWINKNIMSPAIPGTYGLASGNTIANAYFTYESGDAAVKNFQDGEYLWGGLNTGFTLMNAYAPYMRFKSNYKAVPDFTGATGINTAGGYIPFKPGAADLFNQARNLPHSFITNPLYAKTGLSKRFPKIFKPHDYTQAQWMDDFSKATLKYHDLNKKTGMEQTLLKYNPK